MSFFITDRQGSSTREPDESAMDAVLAELDAPLDEEHAEVSLCHESGWTLGAYASGRLVWENVEEDDEPRHLEDTSRTLLRDLWVKLAEGQIADIDAQPWRPGYGP